MSSGRRDFLRAAAAMPLIFELNGCSGGPAWFSDALRAMRTEGLPGLVFRLPADPGRRCALGHELAWLLERTDVDIARRSILLCLESEAVRRRIEDAQETDDLIRIDGEGVAVDGRPLAAGVDLFRRAAELLDGQEPRSESLSVAPRLPYGVSIAAGSMNPCRENPACRFGRGCMECGMARVSPRSQAFVKFLAS